MKKFIKNIKRWVLLGITIICFALPFPNWVYSIVKEIQFTANCSSYLKLSAEANSVVKYIEISAELGCWYKLANCEITMSEVVEYINELESENERLLEQRDKTYNIWVKDTEKLKERIAGLESENARLTLERDVLVKKDCRSLKTKESIVAPIYFLPNAQTPEMVLKLGEKNLVCQFAERMKERLKEKVNSDNVDAFVECSSMIRDLLREFVEE